MINAQVHRLIHIIYSLTQTLINLRVGSIVLLLTINTLNLLNNCMLHQPKIFIQVSIDKCFVLCNLYLANKLAIYLVCHNCLP